MDRFRELGIEMEVFGNNTIAVKEIPELLLESNYSNAVQRFLNEMERLYRDGLFRIICR